MQLPFPARLARGVLAGALATVPMSAAFSAGKVAGLLATLPPEQITAEVGERAEIDDDLSEPTVTTGWLVAHHAYGAACGALYVVARPILPRSPIAAGLIFGAAVWLVSYGFLMPALRLFPPMNRDAPGRIATTALAHAVYGSVLAAVEPELVNRTA